MPENSIMQLYVPAKDYEARDEHRNTIAAKSEAVGVKPFAPLGSGPIKSLDAGLSS